jgi:hypothetical protein
MPTWRVDVCTEHVVTYEVEAATEDEVCSS